VSEKEDRENVQPSQSQAEQQGSKSAQQQKKAPPKHTGKFAPTNVRFKRGDNVELDEP
jgi:hypothetical protein